MSELISSAVSDAGDAHTRVETTRSTVSAGALLHQGRVAAGLHIAALAVSLKVPVRRLEALEADRFDLLPDAVFVRALASSVCRALKMDAGPVLALLPTSAPPRLSAASSRSHDTYSASDTGRALPSWRSLSRPVGGAAAALVVATLALLAWPLVQTTWQGEEMRPGSGVVVTLADGKLTNDGVASGSVASQIQPVTEVATSAAALPAKLQTAPAEPPILTPAPVAASVPPSPSAAASKASGPATLTSAPQAPVQALAAPLPASANPQVSTGIVVFRPTASSWVEVTDAKGTVVLRRVLAAGEVVGASGVLPLSAVVGRADVTQVQVRGQAFDLSSIARENVARFEVK